MSSASAHRQEVKDKVKAMVKEERRKEVAEGGGSLPIRIMQSDLYDWNPSRRMLLLVLALGTRTDPEAWIQEDCPWTAEEMVGYCDMAQWRLALRVGKSESQVHKDLMQMEEDGVIHIDRWQDSNHADHNRYRIIEDMVNEHQRPKQKPDVERPPRYKKPRPKKGWFSTHNQPRRNPEVAEMDEE
jgi:hypothetical protein